VRVLFAADCDINTSQLCYPSKKQKMLNASLPQPPEEASGDLVIDSFCLPPAKPSEIIAEAVKDGEITLDPTEDRSSSSDEDEDEDQNDVERERDGSGTVVADDDKSESEYVNEDAEYSGPEIVTTSSVFTSMGLRVLKVYEDNIVHDFFALDDIPKVIGM